MVRKLAPEGHQNLIVRTRQELDLLDQAEVNEFSLPKDPSTFSSSPAILVGFHANAGLLGVIFGPA